MDRTGKEPVRAQSKRELSPKELELFDCCHTGNVGRIRRLLRFGVVDVNMARHGETLLCIAAYKGFAIIVRELLSMPGIYLNLAQKDGVTPLFLAVQQGKSGSGEAVAGSAQHQQSICQS